MERLLSRASAPAAAPANAPFPGRRRPEDTSKRLVNGEVDLNVCSEFDLSATPRLLSH